MHNCLIGIERVNLKESCGLLGDLERYEILCYCVKSLVDGRNTVEKDIFDNMCAKPLFD